MFYSAGVDLRMFYSIASAPSYVELMYKVGDRWMIGQHTFQQKPPLHRLLPFACLRNTLHDTIHRLPHIHLFWLASLSVSLVKGVSSYELIPDKGWYPVLFLIRVKACPVEATQHREIIWDLIAAAHSQVAVKERQAKRDCCMKNQPYSPDSPIFGREA